MAGDCGRTRGASSTRVACPTSLPLLFLLYLLLLVERHCATSLLRFNRCSLPPLGAGSQGTRAGKVNWAALARHLGFATPATVHKQYNSLKGIEETPKPKRAAEEVRAGSAGRVARAAVSRSTAPRHALTSPAVQLLCGTHACATQSQTGGGRRGQKSQGGGGA